MRVPLCERCAVCVRTPVSVNLSSIGAGEHVCMWVLCTRVCVHTHIQGAMCLCVLEWPACVLAYTGVYMCAL